MGRRSLTPLLTLLVLVTASMLLAFSTADQPPSALARSNQAYDPDAPNGSFDSAAQDLLANCRYGVTTDEDHTFVVTNVGAGVFYKFDNPHWVQPSVANNAELVRMIKVKQNKTESGEYLPGYYTHVPLNENLGNLIRNNSEETWIVGNEMERGPNPGKTETLQGDTFPEVYAEAYHDIYNFIKGNDPTARVAIGGLIEPTPGRLQYLDMVWDAYEQKYGETMPVDVWTIHVYPLPEVKANGEPNNIANVALGTDPSLGKRMARNADECSDPDVYCMAEHDDLSIIEEHVLAIRTWMKDHGQKEKPLLITEYGTVYGYGIHEGGICLPQDEFGNCFTPERVAQFLNDSFDYFNDATDPQLGYSLDGDRLVQQVIWFSVWASGQHSSNLLEQWFRNDLSLTGQAFQDYVSAEPTAINVLVDGTSASVHTAHVDGTFDASLQVSFRNNGNVAVDQPFTVTFYKDQLLTETIGSTVVSPIVRGCATRAYKAEVEWEGLPAGVHPFWVKLDSSGALAEGPGGTTDNIGFGTVDTTNIVYDLTVQISHNGQGEGGVVTRNPALPGYPAGSQVTLTAAPFNGWHFDGWSGAATGSNPIAQITMLEDSVVQAEFTQDQYTFDLSITGNGEVGVNPDSPFYVFGQRVGLTARPATGWRLGSWGGHLDGSAPFMWLEFDSDKSVSAAFVKDWAYIPITVSGE